MMDFFSRMTSRGRQIEQALNEVKKDAALRIDRNLVYTTPVDTGRARSNWIASRGAPKYEQANPDSTAMASYHKSAQEISRSNRSDEVIYITNTLPYIVRLNEGYSAQAPAGFVQRSINSAASAVRGKKLLERGAGR